jgi:hypothetical protein
MELADGRRLGKRNPGGYIRFKLLLDIIQLLDARAALLHKRSRRRYVC